MIPLSGPWPRSLSRSGLLPSVLAAALVAAAGTVAPPARAGDADALFAADEESRLRGRLADGPPSAASPSAEHDAVRAWAWDLAAEGRRRAGTDLGGDLLSGAASALETHGIELPRALGLIGEALAAYPPGRADIGFAWFERAVLLRRLGEPEAALTALDEASRCAAAHPGLDAPRDDARRRAALAAQLEGLGRELRADLLTALGRHAEAATVHEETAARRGGRGGRGADGPWERAAVAAYRAGDRERADRAATAAIDAANAARDDGRTVDLLQWRLYARHGALDARGEVQLTDAWPGEAFLQEARTTLHALEGRPGAWRLAMQLASSASAARRPMEAVEMYEFAFRDPSFELEARASSLSRQRILSAALVALHAGDPAKARAWLELAVQYAGGPIQGTEGLSLAIDEALTRAQVARLEPGGGSDRLPPAAHLRPEGKGERRRGGELVVPDSSAVEDEPSGPQSSGPGSERESSPTWIPLALLAALAVCALSVVLGRVRRVRARSARVRAVSAGAEDADDAREAPNTGAPP